MALCPLAVVNKGVCKKTKVFLMGEAVECEGLTHEKYNIYEQLRNYVNAGGELLACGTCIKPSHLEDSLEVCPISTMVDCVNMVIWADKTVTF